MIPGGVGAPQAKTYQSYIDNVGATTGGGVAIAGLVSSGSQRRGNSLAKRIPNPSGSAIVKSRSP